MILSEEEKIKLDNLNERSNKLNKIKDSIFDKTLRELIQLWSKYNIEVLDDMIIFFSKTDSYHKYFNDIDDTKNIYNGIKLIINDFLKILIKEERLIYIGFTVILISIIMYFIGISS